MAKGLKYLLLMLLLILGCLTKPEPEPEPISCEGLTEVELWGECYNIEETTELDLGGSWEESGGLTGEIPVEIGNLTNLVYLYLYDNQLTGEIPPEVCDLIESNNLVIYYILAGNNLTNTCE